MMLFKKDKIFKQFLPVVEKLKELPLPDDFPKSGGIVKIYETEGMEDFNIKLFTENFDFKLIKWNDNAEKYRKIDSGYEIVVVFNKGDQSMMIALSRLNKTQLRAI